MTKKKVYPYINRFSGEIQIMTKSQGKELNEDWARAKVVNNQEGERVFRFHLSAPVTGKDGKVHMGTAIVDLTESDVDPAELEAANGKRETE
ncbi:hypothetical protein [Polynucleobacter sp.]|uniref:hypothetical protein n=1 Tax=Polynucleobacter sp. TaxID=2029855 RepID=UPI003F69C911